MESTKYASILGQYVLVAAFGIDPAVLGVQVAPVAVAAMVAGAISVGGLLRSEYVQIRAMGARTARLLKGAKRGMQMSRWSASTGDLVESASPGLIVAAGIAVFFYSFMMGWWALGVSEGGVTLASWVLHVGIWGCVVSIFAIVWGVWKLNVRIPRLSAILILWVRKPKLVIAAGIVIILGYGILGLLAHGENEGGTTLASWVLHNGVWGCAVGALAIAGGMWKLSVLIPSPVLSLVERARKASPKTTFAAGVFALSCGIAVHWLAYNASGGGTILESWAPHLGFLICAGGTFSIVWGIWKWRNSNRISRRRSKSSNAIRKRLRRAVTNPFLDDQGAFTTSIPSRIKGL